MTWQTNYIDDGYNEPFDIAADFGIHGPCVGEFRPITAAGKAKVVKLMAQGDAVAEANKALAEQLVRWDITGAAGQPIPIAPETLAKVKPLLREKLWCIVMGDLPAVRLEADQKN